MHILLKEKEKIETEARMGEIRRKVREIDDLDMLERVSGRGLF